MLCSHFAPHVTTVSPIDPLDCAYLRISCVLFLFEIDHIDLDQHAGIRDTNTCSGTSWSGTSLNAAKSPHFATVGNCPTFRTRIVR